MPVWYLKPQDTTHKTLDTQDTLDTTHKTGFKLISTSEAGDNKN